MNHKINKQKLRELEFNRRVRHSISHEWYMATGQKLHRNEITRIQNILNSSVSVTIHDLLRPIIHEQSTEAMEIIANRNIIYRIKKWLIFIPYCVYQAIKESRQTMKNYNAFAKAFRYKKTIRENING